MTLGASPAVDGYYSSTQTPLTAVSPSKSTEKPEEAPEEATLMSWMSWTVELANHLTRWWGQRDKDERTAFKALEDKKWNDRKKETVLQTNAHDGVAKHEMERIKQDRCAMRRLEAYSRSACMHALSPGSQLSDAYQARHLTLHTPSFLAGCSAERRSAHRPRRMRTSSPIARRSGCSTATT